MSEALDLQLVMKGNDQDPRPARKPSGVSASDERILRPTRRRMSFKWIFVGQRTIDIVPMRILFFMTIMACRRRRNSRRSLCLVATLPSSQ